MLSFKRISAWVLLISFFFFGGISSVLALRTGQVAGGVGGRQIASELREEAQSGLEEPAQFVRNAKFMAVIPVVGVGLDSSGAEIDAAINAAVETVIRVAMRGFVPEVAFRGVDDHTIRVMERAAPILKLLGVPMAAGTVVTVEQVRRARAAGARIIVSPDFLEDVIDEALSSGLMMVPGVGSLDEAGRAIDKKLSGVKVFPATDDRTLYVNALKLVLPENQRKQFDSRIEIVDGPEAAGLPLLTSTAVRAHLRTPGNDRKRFAFPALLGTALVEEIRTQLNLDAVPTGGYTTVEQIIDAMRIPGAVATAATIRPDNRDILDGLFQALHGIDLPAEALPARMGIVAFGERDNVATLWRAGRLLNDPNVAVVAVAERDARSALERLGVATVYPTIEAARAALRADGFDDAQIVDMRVDDSLLPAVYQILMRLREFLGDTETLGELERSVVRDTLYLFRQV